MAADAILGLGTRVYYSTDGTTYTELTDIMEVEGAPDPEVETVESTPLNPTAYAREFLAGLVNWGKFNFKQYWNKTRFSLLRGRVRTTTYFRFSYPDTSKDEFATIVTKVKPEGASKNTPIAIAVQSQITGAPTFTAA